MYTLIRLHSLALLFWSFVISKVQSETSVHLDYRLQRTSNLFWSFTIYLPQCFICFKNVYGRPCQFWKYKRLILNNPFPYITNLQQTTLKTYLKLFGNSFKRKYNNWIELKTWGQKEKLLVLSNFIFCRHVFKRLSAAEASESVFMRERFKYLKHYGKRRNCSFLIHFSFSNNDFKKLFVTEVSKFICTR